jgi:hypothetical protein
VPCEALGQAHGGDVTPPGSGIPVGCWRRATDSGPGDRASNAGCTADHETKPARLELAGAGSLSGMCHKQKKAAVTARDLGARSAAEDRFDWDGRRVDSFYESAFRKVLSGNHQ